jgi:catechol 2,3-dioxygenase
MAAGTHDLYGNGDDAQPATPGSYGIPPAGFRLPDATRPGTVRLQVADIERSVRYYTQVLGLREIPQIGTRSPDQRQAQLAPHDDRRVLIDLRECPGAMPATRRPHLGLFHFAILLPDRASLGRFVRHLSEVGERAGAGDHLVSEAFYLTDPDGLGIEVYADRPRDTWRRQGRELMMATDPVDVRGLLREAGDTPWTGMPAGTVMGHVHLHVGDIAQADAFYAEAVGLDRTTRRYPGALFLAAGGYHHHLGTNTWAGPTATAPQPDEAQLLAWTLEVPDATSVAALLASLEAAGHPATMTGDDILETRDPWGTRLVVRTSSNGLDRR